MAASSAVEVPDAGLRLPFRLRSVVLLALLAAATWWAYPRAMAAIELHTAATAFADYALCMVGPTGPTLLRDDPAAFLELARRRVVTAQPDERPFATCALGAYQLTGSRDVERAHGMSAWSFAEYQAPPGEGSAPRGAKVADLRVSTAHLADLAEAAWPFAQGGYTRLVKWTPNAVEAIHPAGLPMPGLGSGLPARRSRYRAVARHGTGWVVAFGKDALLEVYESTDGGLTWAPTAPSRVQAETFAGRCGNADRWYTFGMDDDGAHHTVLSYGTDGPATMAELADADQVVVAAACDGAALVAALKPEQGERVSLTVCPFRKACHPVALPQFPGVRAAPRMPLDIARVDGATVVAVNMGDIVRVASSRDDGVTWSPFTVAFDRQSHPELEAHVPVPRRLLTLGSRLFLYGGAPEPSQTYPVLVSEDQGATWREPAAR